MSSGVDYLEAILARKRVENARRSRHARPWQGYAGRLVASDARLDRGASALIRLRRARGDALRVIAEIKLRSPSAGMLRARTPGAVQAIALDYMHAGAAAISVLCDGPGFAGSALDLRRVAATARVPLLFKEFVLDPIQVTLARAVGAHMVLLIVRALEPGELNALVEEVLRQGMAPVVEAADEAEVERALATRAAIIGVNARDLRTFRVDPERARRALERIPAERIAVHMSGIASADDLARVSGSRADAVLIGEALMRAPSPGARLAEWQKTVPST
jgi:indole-3-glycerol phosphate synthase